MKNISYLAMAILGITTFAPLKTLAQAAVTDPSAVVPPVVYQSVFNESPTGVETKSVDWKKANAEVAQFKRGHVDILKWEENQLKEKPAGNPMSKPEAAMGKPGLPTVPVAPPASAVPAVPTPHKH